MVEDILDSGEFYIKVRCPKCKKLIELEYSEWITSTKVAQKKRTCKCGNEWRIKITAERSKQ